jgi:hypothetical protein
MTHLQTRYTELQSTGPVPLYSYKHAPPASFGGLRFQNIA